MTKKELEQRKAELEQQNVELLANFRQLMAEKTKPSKVRQCWTRCKPYIIPFILGVIVGGFWSPQIPLLHQTSIEKQAALGGAAIPFPSEPPSPNPSASPPENSRAESTASSSMSTSEPPLLPSPPADNGRIPSTRFYRPPLRQTR